MYSYSGVEDLGDQDVVVVEVLSLPEELLFVVLVADVREFGRGSRVYRRFHVDDVADMSFVVLVISIHDKYEISKIITEKAMGSLWGSWSPLPLRPSQTFYFIT